MFDLGFKQAAIGIMLFISILSVSLYSLIGNHAGLKWWLSEGKQHYQLLETVNQLGGIDGMIKKIETKLRENPDDTAGWSILEKLYKANGDVAGFEKFRESIKGKI